MKLIPLSLFSLCSLLTVLSMPLEAVYDPQRAEKVSKREGSGLSVQEQYSAAMDALQKKDWETLIKHATIVCKNFPSSPFSHEATFYLAVGYFNLKEYELANKHFSGYLKKQTTPKHFEEAIQYKFSIAEKYKGGAKKHVMGIQAMPKWIPAREDAIGIYDEVITALPHHDLGAQALHGKAKLLLKDEDYKAAVETYQTLIRRFPKHALASDCYLGIGQVYLTQCQAEYPDPDFLDLAEINLRKFGQHFPGDKRVSEAQKMVLEMKELYARNLFDTAEFYERTNKPQASVIYYTKVIHNYPDTKTAELSKKKLSALKTAKKAEAPKAELKKEPEAQQPAAPQLELAPAVIVEAPAQPKEEPKQEIAVSTPEVTKEEVQAAQESDEVACDCGKKARPEPAGPTSEREAPQVAPIPDEDQQQRAETIRRWPPGDEGEGALQAEIAEDKEEIALEE